MIPKHLYPWNFLALPEELSDYKTAKAVVLPVPYEATVSYGAGTRNGPGAIIMASRQVETYDHEFGGEPCRVGIATLGEVEQVSTGPAEMVKKIEQVAHDILSDDKFLITLGGEHSISSGLVKAHKCKYADLTVLHFDAHSDLRDEYQGTKYSHACAMSRIWEISDFVSVGIRSFSGSKNEEIAFSEGRIITALEFHKNENIISNILSLLSGSVYITFDLDGFDPSVMPAVGTPEPGGLLWDETLDVIRAVGNSKRIVGADIVELAPIPGLTYPDFTAARLVYKLIGKALLK
jgi:agmatinase